MVKYILDIMGRQRVAYYRMAAAICDGNAASDAGAGLIVQQVG